MSFAVIGEVIAGRYELEELLGIGGMSAVYRAHDRLLERTVALKLLHDRYSNDDEYVERFRREARAAARLSHPNIVTVIDRGEQDGHQFIVFEHVDGETLKQLVDRSGPLPIGRALELALQVGRALSFAHERGLVHRDVKPQNVLLNGDGRAKVTDFGIARTVDVEGATTTGTVVGTSHYISPEQARGEKVDAQSDVYSLGAVLYELLTGEVPFPGDNFVTVAMRHVNEPVPSLLEKRPEVPLRVAGAVERALEKEPANRFRSMGEFTDELQACLDPLGTEGDQEPTLIVRSPVGRESRRRRERGRRSAWPLALPLAGLALGAIAAGIYLARGGGSGGEGHASGPIKLTAVSSYDPKGDGSELNEIVDRATDGNRSSYWQTDVYRHAEFYDAEGNPKPGVGIILDARRPVKPKKLTITTGTPGIRAVIRAGDSSAGPFSQVVSGTRTVDGTTTFDLRETSAVRYFLVWITGLGGHTSAEINEVTAS